jgi:hypothetical protein
MLNLFRAVIDRLKALLATTAALELEAEVLARHAERKAELLRQAESYEADELPAVAGELRQQAEALDLRQPRAGVRPALEHGLGQQPRPALPAVPDTSEPSAPADGRRKGRRP